MYDHLVVKGHSREIVVQVKSLVKEKMSHTPWATPSTIVLVASNFFLSKHLLNEDGKGLMEVLKGANLHQVMDKFIALSSFNIWNLIVSFKHQKGMFLTFLLSR
jgi:hypothetical protein